MQEVFNMAAMSRVTKYMVIGAAVGAVGSGAIGAFTGKRNKTKRKVQKALRTAGSVMNSVGYMMK